MGLRTLLACERLLRVGGVAPRIVAFGQRHREKTNEIPVAKQGLLPALALLGAAPAQRRLAFTGPKPYKGGR